MQEASFCQTKVYSLKHEQHIYIAFVEVLLLTSENPGSPTCLSICLAIWKSALDLFSRCCFWFWNLERETIGLKCISVIVVVRRVYCHSSGLFVFRWHEYSMSIVLQQQVVCTSLSHVASQVRDHDICHVLIRWRRQLVHVSHRLLYEAMVMINT